MLTKTMMSITILASLVAIGCDDDDDIDLDDDIDEGIDEDIDEGDIVPPPVAARCFTRDDLVGSTDLVAQRTDPALINAWGMSPVLGAFGVVAEATGTLAMYTARGEAAATVVPDGLKIGEGATGIASNGEIVAIASAEGLISKFSLTADPTNVVVRVDNSEAGAVYLGLAFLDDVRLLAANFRDARIEVYETTQFQPLTSPTFVAPASIPAGFAPFNVAVLDDVVYVAYAQQDAERDEEVTGVGLGYVTAFSPDGTALWTVGGAPLDAPWGMAIAPAAFEDLGGTLLVGNFGDGRITAIDRSNARIVGQLLDAVGAPIVIDGLWGIDAGVEVADARADAIYFAAGPTNETAGLYGALHPCD